MAVEHEQDELREMTYLPSCTAAGSPACDCDSQSDSVRFAEWCAF
jgi:hypothetical protein